MNNYVYIVASLPDITAGWKFGDKGPEDYIEEIVNLCSDKDRALIDFLLSGYLEENLNIDFYAKAQAQNKSLDFLGVLVTKADERKNYFKQTIETLSSLDNVRLLESIIRIDSTIEWSQDNSKPVMAYKKTSRAAGEYMEMAQEVMKYADR